MGMLNIDKKHKWGPQGISRKFRMGGWFGEGRRHSLAALGVKTGTKTKINPVFQFAQKKVREDNRMLVHSHHKEEISEDYAKRIGKALLKSPYTKQMNGLSQNSLALAIKKINTNPEKYLARKQVMEKYQQRKDMIEMTTEKFKELKRKHEAAVASGQEQFEFEGRPVLTSYSKYLLEYLGTRGFQQKKLYTAHKLTESDVERMKKLFESGVDVDQIKDAFGDSVDPADVQKEFDKIRSSNRLEVQRQQAEAFGEDLEVDVEKGTTKVGSSLSVEEASQRVAQSLRDTGQAKSGSGELTATNVRRIIRDAGFKPNSYAATYINTLDDAETMYGTDGVKSQIAYIFTNLRATTPEQKVAKKELKDLITRR